jgi:hypothetical protein
MLTRAISYVAAHYAHLQASVRISADGRRIGRLSRTAKLQRIRRIIRNARKHNDLGRDDCFASRDRASDESAPALVRQNGSYAKNAPSAM